jgi:hypothetical protein
MSGQRAENVMITVAFDAVEFWLNIFGSGWETWDWWVGVRYLGDADWNKPDRVVLEIKNPDDDESTITKEIGLSDLVEAWNKAVHTSCELGTGADLDIENLDASSSDCILQTAVLGKVIYG